MITHKSIESIEPSAVRLSVTVSGEAAQKEYNALLATYSKKAHIKGFRPGKAPVKVLETKFGESLRLEAAQKLIEEALKTVFEEIDEKPLGYEGPSLEGDIDFQPGQEFGFVVKYDVFPKVDVAQFKGMTIEEPQVKIEKEDLNRELEALREQNAIVVDKKDAAAEDGHIVTVDYAEADSEGATVPGTAREDFSFTLGKDENFYKIDSELKGMKVGESKVVEKTYGEDAGPLANRTLQVKITLKNIKIRELPDLDDELAQDIDEEFKTLEDLKKSIQSRLEESAKSQLRQKKIQALTELLVEKNPVSVPESMVQAELQSNWANFLRQFGGNDQLVLQVLQAQGSSQQQLFEDWRPGATARLKGQLIIQKLIEQEGVEAEEAEIEEEIARQAKGSNMGVQEAKDYFFKNNLLEYVKQEIRERKVFDKLFELNTVKKGAKVKFLDLMQRNG